MQNNITARYKKIHLWLLESIIGLIIMAVVFVIAVNVDITTTQKNLSNKAQYSVQQFYKI